MQLRPTTVAPAASRRRHASAVVDHAQLLAMGVVRQRLDDVRTGVDEFLVQLSHQIGMLEHDLGDESAGLKVSAALELEQIPLGADHGPVGQAPEETAVSWVGRVT